MKRILVVDDDLGSRESLRTIFKFDYEVLLADSGEAALLLLKKESVDLVLLDVIMPGINGISTLKEILRRSPNQAVLMVSASTSIKPVVDAIKEGALDFVTKPFEIDTIRLAVARALQTSSLQQQVTTLQADIQRSFPTQNIVGRSPGMHQALSAATQAATNQSTLLVSGEAGTGKELMARFIHEQGDLADDPFVTISCGTLTEALLEHKLFGMEGGSTTHSPGAFDLATSGTVLLDDVGALSPALQSKLLTVVQNQEFVRVGGTQVHRTKARIIATCNQNLKADIAAGRFREDLYNRLSVIALEVLPLRHRLEDLPLLVEHFARACQRNNQRPVTSYSDKTIARMNAYPWPGNLQELRNIVERMAVLHPDATTILPEHLPAEFHDNSLVQRPAVELGKTSLDEAVNAYERDLVENALVVSRGIQTRAAEMLGTTRRILKYRMEKLNISDDRAHYR